jgi:alpha-2-macroglobulin
MRCRALALALSLIAPAPALADSPFEVMSVEVQAERELPEACVTFSHPLLRPPTDYGDYVELAPRADHAVLVDRARLCVEGLEHGERYTLALREGLPGEGGRRLEAASFELEVPDRQPSVHFPRPGRVLPYTLGEGLPVRTVNLDEIEIRIIRIHDGNLVQQIRSGMVDQPLNRWAADYLADEHGEEVWRGRLVVRDERNRAVTTALPLDDTVGRLQPGIYAVTATAAIAQPEPWMPFATQWLVASDIGLASFKAENGLVVHSRSLGDGEALDGVRLRLMARNGSELGTAVTDEDGLARFPAGLLRGTGGNRAQAVFAYGEEGDFVDLDLEAPALDLADRGVAGREPPGPLDAFLYTERGIYRPGETVHVTALLRDQRAHAVAGLPLTLRLLRPDGHEGERVVLDDRGEGGHGYAFELPPSAFTGTWSASAHIDPDGPSVGRVDFLVEDFVPPRLELTVEGPDAPLAAGDLVQLDLEARYLYDAPGAGLSGEATLIVQPASDPFPGLAGWRFGLEQEDILPVRLDAVPFGTDEEGRARVELPLDDVLDGTWPLEAVARATVFDIDGRPLTRETTLPVHHQPYLIGIRPGFDGRLPEGASARFEVMALDPDGAPVARERLRFELYEEQHDYVWYEQRGRWDYEVVVRDRPVTGGRLDLGAEAATLELPVTAGRFRLEVLDPGTGVATSVRFSAGWWHEAVAAERPDEVEVTVEDLGDGTARAFVRPPFEAEVLLATADRNLHHTELRRIGTGGAFVELPVAEDDAAGLYVLAMAFAPPGEAGSPLPRRAVGLAWLPRDPAPRLLEVALEHAERAQPQTTETVTLRIDGARPEEPVHVTLAAVDEAVLRITDYRAPDPVAHHLGQRRLGVELRDVYGQLIDPSGVERGRVRVGGDLARMRQVPGLPARTDEVAAIFSGILTVGVDGTVEVPLALPDFSGQLRLMAVAWSTSRIGRGESAMLVRSPVIAELTRPRFLAPGDEAHVTLLLRNLDAPEGTFQARLRAEGATGLDSSVVIDLAPGESLDYPVTLAGVGLGVGRIRLDVRGPEGLELTRSFPLSVRAPHPMVTRRHLSRLEPGRRLTLSPDLVADLHPETASVSLSLGPLPDLDMGGLLAALDRYPYGCAEQITSRALPLLHLGEVADALGITAGAARDARIREVIQRLVSLQTGYGSFGAWSPFEGPDLWLSAYVLDFLERARVAGHHVPRGPTERGLAWMMEEVTRGDHAQARLPGLAYAAYVLARAGTADLATLRYLNDTLWARLPTTLARAHMAAALAIRGDMARARDGVADLDGPRLVLAEMRDYGSGLRDDAAVLAVLGEAGLLDEAELMARGLAVAERLEIEPWLSTQEQAWLLLASHVLLERAGPMRLEVEDGVATRPFRARFDVDALAGRPAMRNLGEASLYQALSLDGVPLEPQPPESRGFTIERRILGIDGEPADLSGLVQNRQLVVLIEGRAEGRGQDDALIVDLLPAGLEIENLRLEGTPELEEYAWLGELSQARFTEFREDRYVAALDLRGDERRFRLAYVVRAVTPGDFTLPATFVESMYAPHRFARGEAGRISVRTR